MTRRQLSLFGFAALAVPQVQAQQPGHSEAEGPDGWVAALRRRLPYLGHRNWIVVADSAYPLQSNPGIETIVSNADHLHVLRVTLDQLSKMPHVRPIIYTDKELQFVPDADAPGMTSFRQRLGTLLNSQPANTMPHEEIIHHLDEAARVFNVLIIKTNLTLPYTSVFLQLDCAYWGADAEQRLRQSMTGR